MSRPALPRASFLGTALRGGVAPASAGTVSVPLNNPALELEARSYGSLAQRLNAFSQQAFGIAETRAKTAGQVYGIENAPTLEQVESAAQLGQPVEVKGDISSTRIFDQAAYAGSMAVVESHYATAAQKSMTDIFVKADADNTMKPAEVHMQMQAVVTEYTKSLSMLDASSAAKLTNKLGVMANSNRMQQQMVDGAIVASDDHLDLILPPLIKGYDAKNSKVPLDVSLRSSRGHLEGMLTLRGVGIVKRNEILDRFDKLVIDNKIDAIVRMSEDATGTDPKNQVIDMIKNLREGKADKSKQEIYNSLNLEGQRKARTALLNEGTALKSQLADDDEAKKAAHAKTYSAFQNQIYDPNFKSFDKVTNEIIRSNLPPRGDLGKQSLLNTIRAIKKEASKAPSTSQPSSQEVLDYAEILERIHLKPDDKDHVTHAQLLAGKVKMRKTNKFLDLPITGRQGNNLTSLISRAKTDQDLQTNLLNAKKEELYRIIKSAVGADDVLQGGKNHAADTVYARAVQELENLFQGDVDKGKILDLLDHDFFKKDSVDQLLLISKYRNRLPTIQQSMKEFPQHVKGMPQVLPRSVPLTRFMNAMKAYALGRNFKLAANYLSKPEVFNRQITEKEAEDYINKIFQVTP